MRVSIVTISFNQSQFIEETIRSVIEQDYQDIEYIVVDSGSMDDSREIIERYRNKISQIIFEPDDGPADGLNKGFRRATGQIFAFLNADDFLLPRAVSHIVECFQSHPDADVVTGHAIVVDANSRKLRKLYGHPFSLLDSAYSIGFAIQPSTFFKASAYLKTNGFNIQNHTNWDDELFIDMKLQERRFKFINQFLSAYRVHSSSFTGKSNDLYDSNLVKYQQKRFEKIMGRKQNRMDAVLHKIFWVFKLIRNPLETLERISHGPLYGRYKHSKS